MAAKNDITGDSIVSKVNSQKFQDNFDAIFRKDKRLNELKEMRDNYHPICGYSFDELEQMIFDLENQ